MKQKIKKNFTYWLKVAVIGLALGLAIQFVRAWTEPSASPPGGNVGAPINTSTIDQTKGNTTSGKINAKDFCLNSDPTKCLSNAGGGTATCGNGVCESGETSSSCPGDCSITCPCGDCGSTYTQWLSYGSCMMPGTLGTFTCTTANWVLTNVQQLQYYYC